MHPSELFDELKHRHDLKSDSDVARETLIKSDPFGLSLSKPLLLQEMPFDRLRANGINQCFPRLLGLTPARVSQMRMRKGNVSARQIASYLEKAHTHGHREAMDQPILPIVEMYPIDAVLSKQEKKWEPLPTGKSHPRNRAIRDHLEAAAGIYVLFDSLGCPIYVGKTEKQNLWKEMTNAFNRERSNHQTFAVSHPTTGTTFSPAWESPRQPVKQTAYLYNTASFFSAYKVTPALVPRLEAFLVRVFCNTLSNKKMEKF